MIAFEISHTADTLRAAYTAWWKKRFRLPYWAAGCVALGAVSTMLLLSAAPWFAVVVATASMLAVAFLDSLRANAVRLALLQLEVLGAEPLRFEIDADGLRERSPLGRAEMPWSSFEGLEYLEPCVLLRRKPRQAESFIVFPREQLPPDALALLAARFEPAPR